MEQDEFMQKQKRREQYIDLELQKFLMKDQQK